MKQFIILIPIVAAIILIPLKYTSASNPHLAVSKNAQTSLPMASSVMGLSGTISAAGAVGYLILSRNKDR